MPIGTANVYMTTTYKNYYANDGDCKKTNQHNPDYINNGGEGSFAQVFWQANGGKGAGRVVPSRGALRLYNYKGMGEQDDRVSANAIVWSINDVDAAGNVTKVFDLGGTALIDTTVNAAMLTSTSIKNMIGLLLVNGIILHLFWLMQLMMDTMRTLFIYVWQIHIYFMQRLFTRVIK